jgi:hypothetical protein
VSFNAQLDEALLVTHEYLTLSFLLYERAATKRADSRRSRAAAASGPPPETAAG